MWFRVRERKIALWESIVLCGMGWLAVFISPGCAGQNEKEEQRSEAIAIAHSQAENYVGKRVKVTAWILGGGKSFRTPGPPEFFYYVLVPDPEVDWKAVAEWQARTEGAVKLLSSQEGDTITVEDGAAYRRTIQVLDEYRALVQAQEEKPEARIWGRLKRKVFGEVYGLMPDMPSSWEIRTRRELVQAYESLLYRFRLLMGSVEVELTGILYRSTDRDSSGIPFPSSVQTKPLVMEVESMKTLRTAKDVAGADGPPSAVPIGEKSQ